MDLITQGLLGSTVAQAGCSQELGRRAALYGFLVGLLPDSDIVAGLISPWVSLKYHRGPTHSFIILPFLAYPIGLLCKKISGSEANTSTWVKLAFLSLITHPVIDWFTSYGTCLFWPLTNRRFAADALSIIDPLYSLPLLLVTLAGLIGLFSPRRITAFACIALIATTLYSGWGYKNSQDLIRQGQHIFKSTGFMPVEVRATPSLFNIFVFRVVARDAQNRYMITFMRHGNPEPLIEPILRVSAIDSYTEKALSHPNGKLFQWFSMNMTHSDSIVQPDGTRHVYLNDMRYGLFLTPGKTLFSARAVFDANDDIIAFDRMHNRSSVNARDEFKATLSHAFPWLFSKKMMSASCSSSKAGS